MSVNKVILLGNVGKDPEVRYIESEKVVANFSLATSKSYTKNGEKVVQTEWHNIVVWNKIAKVVEQYVKKGSQLYLEGEIRTRSYEKDGITKYITEIVVTSLSMLGSVKSTEEKPENPQKTQSLDGLPEDDLPF